ncbi:pilus assembly protein [Kitasatospora sp. NPDC093806]|uniref:pilus assembly protein n=1 Tax=Kitasatospora sp. NPDC093806 TaxID=3155075 RepID=UPI00342716A2
MRAIRAAGRLPLRLRRLAGRRVARSTHGPDGGGVAVEMGFLAPAIAALILATVAVGRVETAAGMVEAAARSSARTASLARSVAGMDEAAKKAAKDSLEQQGVRCANANVASVAHGELVSHGVAMATVEVTVRCEVGLSDLVGGPDVPLTKTLTGRFVSVVDRYRSR